MTKIIVTDLNKPWDYFNDFTVISPAQYLNDPQWHHPKIKIVNLCRNFNIHAPGGIVSSFATANGQKVIPQDFLSPYSNYAGPGFSLFPDLQISKDQKYLFENGLNIFFGLTTDINFTPVGIQAFRYFPHPYLKLTFTEDGKSRHLQAFNLEELNAADWDFFVQALQVYLKGKSIGKKDFFQKKYDFAILVDINHAREDDEAIVIQKFLSTAEKMGFNSEIITINDAGKIPQFDALFCYTNHQDFSQLYPLVTQAESQGVVVINPSGLLLRSRQKFWLWQQMQAHMQVLPFQFIIDQQHLPEFYPMILSNWWGEEAETIRNQYELQEKMNRNKCLVQQIPEKAITWYLDIFNGELMNTYRQNDRSGDWKLYQPTPPEVISACRISYQVLGEGFYRVVIKEIENQFFFQDVSIASPLQAPVDKNISEGDFADQVIQYFISRLDSETNHTT